VSTSRWRCIGPIYHPASGERGLTAPPLTGQLSRLSSLHFNREAFKQDDPAATPQGFFVIFFTFATLSFCYPCGIPAILKGDDLWFIVRRLFCLFAKKGVCKKMPCNGVTVATATVNYDLSEVINSPDGLNTAAILLKKQGITFEVISKIDEFAVILVDGNLVSIKPGQITSTSAPQKTVNILKNVFESVAGILGQQRVIDTISRNSTVLSTRETKGGYVVMSVRI
jgi:hypothetical protein